MKRIIQLILILLLTAFRPLENPCGVMTPRGGDQDWGVGVCLVPEEKQLPIYDPHSYESIGYLTRTRGSMTLLFDNQGNKLEQILGHGIEYIGHFELTFLQVEKISNNNSYYFINWKSEEHKYAIKKTDLDNIAAKFYTYRELLTSSYLPEEITKYRSWATLGVNASKTCLNLRQSPSIYGEKITCVRGNDWGNETQTRLKILEVADKWAKLEVQLMVLDQEAIDKGDFEDCYPYKLDQEITGWVKFVDDDGFPNLWYSVTSY